MMGGGGMGGGGRVLPFNDQTYMCRPLTKVWFPGRFGLKWGVQFA